MTLLSFSAHYDGSQVLFDEDVNLPPDAKLIVTVLGDSDDERADFHQLSSSVLANAYDEDEIEYTEEDLIQ